MELAKSMVSKLPGAAAAASSSTFLAATTTNASTTSASSSFTTLPASFASLTTSQLDYLMASKTATTTNASSSTASPVVPVRGRSMVRSASISASSAGNSASNTNAGGNVAGDLALGNVNSKPPKWSRQMSIAVPLYRTALDRTKHSLRRSRSLASLVPSPLPEGTTLHPTTMPRRNDLIVNNDPNNPQLILSSTNVASSTVGDSNDVIHGEWVVDGNAVKAERSRRLRNNKSGNGIVKSVEETEEDLVFLDDEETVVLYLHGGAYFMCSPTTHRAITSRISQATGSRVLSVDYRLAPEHPYPYPLHDAVSAYLSLIDPLPGSKTRKYRPEQVVVAGDSAGGGLAIALSLWIRDHGSKKGWKMPGGIVTMAPWVDICLDPYVSPLFASDQGFELNGLPRTLIQLGSRERLRDEGIMFAAESFRNSNVRVEVYEDMVHIFQAFAALGEPMAVAAIKRIGEFVRDVGARSRKAVSNSATTAATASTTAATKQQQQQQKPGFYWISGDNVESEVGREVAVGLVEMGRRELAAKTERQQRNQSITTTAADIISATTHGVVSNVSRYANINNVSASLSAVAASSSSTVSVAVSSFPVLLKSFMGLGGAVLGVSNLGLMSGGGGNNVNNGGVISVAEARRIVSSGGFVDDADEGERSDGGKSSGGGGHWGGDVHRVSQLAFDRV
ncbi:hypothetical protein HDU76_007371 [Blyttiomyces sp. JEL0837]|nr:hypothetical protein HDU76_007371 [Blyttiomyces sp. JEL0837]